MTSTASLSRTSSNRSRLSRRSVLGLLAAGGASVGAGCTRGYGQVSGSVPDQYRKRLHLVAWHSFGSTNGGETLDKLVKKFNRSQSDIYLEAQYQGGYEQSQQKLSAAIVGHQIPDLAILSEVTWRQMHLADALEPLENYFDSELKPDDYIEEFIKEGTVKGHIWWLPYARSTPLFYFNKSIFKSAGLPQRAPHTWDEFRKWAPEIKKVKAGGQHTMPLALNGGNSAWFFQCNMWEWDAHFSKGLDITLDQSNGISAANWMTEFIRRDNAAYLTSDSQTDFGNQAAAAGMLSTASLAQINDLAKENKFEVGTGMVPKHDKFGCCTGGSGWGVMAKTSRKRKQAAFEFLKFLAKPENAATWTIETGYLPIVKKAQQDPRLVHLMKKDPNFTTSLRQLPKCKTQDLARLIIPDSSNFMDRAFEQLYSSGQSPRKSFGQLADKLRKKADLMEDKYRSHYK